ncbi:MAG: OmpA family protein [Pseudomonadales bacterium]|nr:OmpA family protein [Pseudomonadales bacterium]
MKTLIAVTTAVALIFLQACSSAPKLSEAEAMYTYPKVAELQQALLQTNDKNLSLLAPINYQQAKDSLSKAETMAKEDNEEASEVALNGQKYLNNSLAHAQSAGNIFAEVMEARKQAIERGSLNSTSAKLQEVDNAFTEVTKKYEKGDQASAKVRRPEMIQRYKDLEMTAVKKLTVDQANAALKQAKQAGAEKYASKTYASAEQELNLAISILESDLNNQDKAMMHAKKSIWQSQRSMHIIDTVKEFNENNFSSEDIVLWYQQQLVKAVGPTGKEVPLNQPNHELVTSVAVSIQSMNKEQQNLKLALTDSDKRFNDGARMRHEREKAVEDSQELFSDDEATVYLQHENVLIRAHGFSFQSGGSEIDAQNFALLNKINKTIEKFPESTIVVSGHSDSTGNEKANMSLSKERAEKVALFLSEVGGISTSRLSYEGYGKNKPVESNGTSEGRASNRRVEILIKNKA